MTDQTVLRVADLSQNAPTGFDLRPDPEALKALAGGLGIGDLRKLRFYGQVAARGRHDWELTGRLGATVVQPCVVTLDPVTTRIETDVSRLYLADFTDPGESEAEMPDDDRIEPLGRVIDLGAVMAEALSLALPLYPRKDGAEPGEAVFTRPGQAPMRDEDARPFAGLAGLRDTLRDKRKD
ncbi:MAG: YceD family protein [Jhaorihella sp.]